MMTTTLRKFRALTATGRTFEILAVDHADAWEVADAQARLHRLGKVDEIRSMRQCSDGHAEFPDA